MKDLQARLAEKFNDPNFEKKYLRTSALYRLADEVLLLRKQRGLTQKELAEKVGTTQAVISRLESASVKPSMETILKIAEALDAAVDVRLLPVESIRRKKEPTEEKKQDPLKGIVYYGLEKAKPSDTDKNWVDSNEFEKNHAMLNISTHPTLRIALKKKAIEYA
ncbi:MAG: helix-turn-helix transcriptional regulator [Chloroflexi bacterium]|nr:helix-turn-helix transcriptional regulator [Chloroflexota bacterium]